MHLPFGGPVVPLENGKTANVFVGSRSGLVSNKQPSFSMHSIKGIADVVELSVIVTMGTFKNYIITVKLDFKELLIKEQIDFKELLLITNSFIPKIYR